MSSLRIHATAWFATGVALTLLASVFVVNAWQASAAPSAQGCSIVSLAEPVRILDTRDEVPEPAGGDLGLAGPLTAGTNFKLQVTGPIVLGKLGTQTVIPAGASSVDFNVTVVSNSAPGFVSVRPGTSSGTPGTSSENFGTANTFSNNFGSVGLPAAGNVDLYFGSGAGSTTDLIIDIVRYCASDTVVVPTTPSTTVATTTPINVGLQTWKIEWQGDRPGIESAASNTYTQARFAITSNEVTGGTPSDNGNASDGGDDSIARSGEVGKGSNMLTVENGKFQSTAPYAPIGTPSKWEFYDLTFTSDPALIKGKFRRVDGLPGNTDTGIFQMSASTMTPLPPASNPALPAQAAGPTCAASDDLAVATRQFNLSGTVPGQAPVFTKMNVRFAVADGVITDQSSQKIDGTDPPYTYAKSTATVICGDRTMEVSLNNSQTNDPPNPDRGLYYLQHVRPNGNGGLMGEYLLDRDAPYSTDLSGAEDVGTFTTS
jgi:hypothetical protein